MRVMQTIKLVILGGCLGIFLVSGVRAGGRENPIPNPGFEFGGSNGPSSWITNGPTPWRARDKKSLKKYMNDMQWSEYSRAEWCADEAHSGKKSIKISALKNPDGSLPLVGWQTSIKNPIYLKGPATVRLSGWMKTRDVTMGINSYCVPTFILLTYDAQRKPVYGYQIPARGTETPWTKYEATYVLSETVEEISVYCLLMGCTGTAWFDDLTLSIEDQAGSASLRFMASILKSPGDVDVKSIGPIIVPKPWQETYGPDAIGLKKVGVRFDEDLQGSQIQKELSAFLKNITGEDVPMVAPNDDAVSFQTLVVCGKNNSECIKTQLKKMKCETDWNNLGEQGYGLVVKKIENQSVVILSAPTDQGLYYAVQTFKQYPVKQGDTWGLHEGVILDKPDFLWRGLCPGGAGLERIDNWMVPLKLNRILGTWRPNKDYKWWESFTDAQKVAMKEWVMECGKRFIDPVGLEHPDRGYVRNVKYTSQDDIRAILQRYGDYYACGVRYFDLSFDDGARSLKYPEDQAAFKSIADAHYYLVNEVYKTIKALDAKNQLVILPLYYSDSSNWSDEQRKYMAVMSRLPKDILFANTGINSQETVQQHIETTGREPLVWDNWAGLFEPIKPFPSVFSPPAEKNWKDLPAHSHGYMFPLLNKPMMWYLASDYMWNAARYDARQSAVRILHKLFGKENMVRLLDYQAFAERVDSLPLKGETTEERLRCANALMAQFSQKLGDLKPSIPADLYAEIAESAQDNIKVLKALISQLASRPFPIQIPSVDAPITVDGDLEKVVWQKAVKLTGFGVPLLGQTNAMLAGQQTEALLLHDNDRLYVGFRCKESAMNTLKTDMIEKDGEVYADDSAGIMLGVNELAESYYHFAVSASGILYDAQGFDREWDGKAQVKTSKRNGEWCVEMAVPFKSFGVKMKKGMRWRFNLCRVRQAGDRPEFSSWAVGLRGFHEPERFWQMEFQ